MLWPLTKRIAFRFLFLYVVLYCLPLEVLPLWRRLVVWIGNRLGVDAPFHFSGSGDKTYDYVHVLCILLVALTGTLVWSLADRKRAEYRNLYLGLRVLVRLFLGMTLIRYGAVKVIPVQFPPPDLHRLLEPFGDASPMGLLWTFMGASTAYNVFAGSVETIAGLLLFFPRTALLGALVSLAAVCQLCALNLCYDVDVKLFTLHLLGMTVFLVAQDAGRLANLFWLNRSVEPASSETVLQRPILLHGAFAVKLVFLAGLVGTAFYGANFQRNMRRRMVEKPGQTRFLLLNRGFHWVNEAPFNR